MKSNARVRRTFYICIGDTYEAAPVRALLDRDVKQKTIISAATATVVFVHAAPTALPFRAVAWVNVGAKIMVAATQQRSQRAIWRPADTRRERVTHFVVFCGAFLCVFATSAVRPYHRIGLCACDTGICK